MKSITFDVIKKLALLSKSFVLDNEMDKFSQQLNQSLHCVSQLKDGAKTTVNFFQVPKVIKKSG